MTISNRRLHGDVRATVHVSWLDPNKIRRTTIVGSRKMLVYDDTALQEKIRVYDRGVTVRPPGAGMDYRSACDPSGGAHDSFTLCVAHNEGEVAVLDCLVEVKPPFNPTTQFVAA